MNDKQEMYYKVRDFICKVTRKQELKDDDDIFEGGIINSLFAMQLVLFLEKQFNIRINGTELKRDNFKNINTIVKFLEEKQSKL